MSNILIFGLLFVVIIIIGVVIIYKQKQKLKQLQKQNKQREAIRKANKKRIKYGCGIGSVLGGSLGLHDDLSYLSSSFPERYNIGEYIINKPSDSEILHLGIIGCPIGAAIGAGINKFKR